MDNHFFIMAWNTPPNLFDRDVELFFCQILSVENVEILQVLEDCFDGLPPIVREHYCLVRFLGVDRFS